jgi:hypothetical protein
MKVSEIMPDKKKKAIYIANNRKIDSHLRSTIVNKPGKEGATLYTKVYETIPVCLALVGVNDYKNIKKLKAALESLNKKGHIDTSQYGINAMIKICDKFGENSIEYFESIGGGVIELLNKIGKVKANFVIHDSITEYYHSMPAKFKEEGEKQNTADAVLCFGRFNSVEKVLKELPNIKINRKINGASVPSGEIVQVSLKAGDSGKARIGKIKTAWQNIIYGSSSENIEECLTHEEVINLIEINGNINKSIIVENVYDIISMSMSAIKNTIKGLSNRLLGVYKTLMSTISSLNNSAVYFFNRQEEEINSDPLIMLGNKVEDSMISPTQDQLDNGEVLYIAEDTKYEDIEKCLLTEDISLIKTLNEKSDISDSVILTPSLIKNCVSFLQANKNVYTTLEGQIDILSSKAKILNKKSDNTIKLIGLLDEKNIKELKYIKQDMLAVMKNYNDFFRQNKIIDQLNSIKTNKMKEVAISRKKILPMFKLAANLKSIKYLIDLFDWIDYNVDRLHTARDKAFLFGAELSVSAIYGNTKIPLWKIMGETSKKLPSKEEYKKQMLKSVKDENEFPIIIVDFHITSSTISDKSPYLTTMLYMLRNISEENDELNAEYFKTELQTESGSRFTFKIEINSVSSYSSIKQ